MLSYNQPLYHSLVKLYSNTGKLCSSSLLSPQLSQFSSGPAGRNWLGEKSRKYPTEVARSHPGYEGGRDSKWSWQERHRGYSYPLHLRLLQSLSLGPPILEPDLDLRKEKRNSVISPVRSQIGLTWVSVSFSSAENSALSEMERYCFSRYFFSRAFSWAVVKGVRGFLLGLCFLSKHRTGPSGTLSLRSAATQGLPCNYDCWGSNLIIIVFDFQLMHPLQHILCGFIVMR